ncbi:MAG: cysteine desulfurase [Planctomycetota bacterium]|nr:cysteine desulfurase [Planctomycetota bacterium]
MDGRKIAQDFPILKQKVHDKRLVYLDSAATSQKPYTVIDALNEYYHSSNANVHRGLHVLAERATEIYECARTRTSWFIHAERPTEIVWTKNATEALNLVAHGWGRRHLKAGDEVVVSRMEHHSNLVPWHLLAKDKGVVVRAIELNSDGTLRLEDLDRFLAGGKVKLVALTHVSNVLGTINPIAEIAKKVHAAGAVFAVDGCQGAPHLPVNVRDLDVDFYAFSAHKMLGPTGLGVLYGKYKLLEQMDPFLGGGEMIEEVRIDSSTYKAPPLRFEAGTPPIAQTAGHVAALEYLGKLGMANVRAHEKDLTAYALNRLKEVAGLKIFGPADPAQRAGVLTFELEQIHAHDIAQVLDSEGIAVRAGHHCAQPLHEWLGAPSSARASFYVYTHQDEIDALARGLEKVRKYFA